VSDSVAWRRPVGEHIARLEPFASFAEKRNAFDGCGQV
jgi:hypothetical protein